MDTYASCALLRAWFREPSELMPGVPPVGRPPNLPYRCRFAAEAHAAEGFYACERCPALGSNAAEFRWYRISDYATGP